MANKRMFAIAIVNSDAFVEMPVTARLLYYDLAVRADDDGFVDSPKMIMRIVGANDNDLDTLIDRNYVMRFKSGVIVITHWHIHNYIAKDRYKPTQHQKEMAMLARDDTGAYKLIDNDTIKDCQQTVYKPYTQTSIDKSSIDKSSVSGSPTQEEIKAYCKEHDYSIDTDRFYNYYEARGWILNGEPVRNWKALINTWALKEQPDNSANNNGNTIAQEKLKQLKARKSELVERGANSNELESITLEIASIEDSILRTTL